MICDQLTCLEVALLHNLEVVTREFLGLADLSGAQTLHIYETAEIVIVDKHGDFMLRAL